MLSFYYQFLFIYFENCPLFLGSHNPSLINIYIYSFEECELYLIYLNHKYYFHFLLMQKFLRNILFLDQIDHVNFLELKKLNAPKSSFSWTDGNDNLET